MKLLQVARNILSVLIIITLVVPPVRAENSRAQAQETTSDELLLPDLFKIHGLPAPDTEQMLKFYGARAYLQSYLSQLSEDDLIKAQSFSKHAATVNLELMALTYGLNKVVDELVKSIGIEKIRERIHTRKDSKAIKYEITGVGKAELTTVGFDKDAPLVIKISHFGTNVSTIIADAATLKLSSLEGYYITDTKSLTPEQLAEHNLAAGVAKELRKFIARLMYKEVNPDIVYNPLQTPTQETKVVDPNLSEKLNEFETLPARELERRSWYQELRTELTRSYLTTGHSLETDESNRNVNKVVLMLVNSELNTHENTEIFVRPESAIKRLKLWMDATLYPANYNKETAKKRFGKIRAIGTGDYRFGIVMGTLLGGISIGAAYGSVAMGGSLKDGLTFGEIAFVSFSWSAGMAVISRSYNEWLNRGTKSQRFMKEQVTGILNSLHLYALTTISLWPVMPDGSLNTVGLIALFDILVNQTIKNYSKPFMKDIPKFRIQTGVATGLAQFPYKWELDRERTLIVPSIKMVLPTKQNGFSMFEYDRIDTKIPALKVAKRWTSDIYRDALEPQLIQLVTTPISLLSRLGLTIGLMSTESVQALALSTGLPDVILSLFVAIPIGHLAYLSLGPMAQQVYIWYREKRYVPQYIRERTAVEEQSGRKYNPKEDYKLQQTIRDTEKLKKEWQDLAIKSKVYTYLASYGKTLHAYLYNGGAIYADYFSEFFNSQDAGNLRLYRANRLDHLISEAEKLWRDYESGNYRGVPLTQYIKFYKEPLMDLSNTLWKATKFLVVKTAVLPKNLVIDFPSYLGRIGLEKYRTMRQETTNTRAANFVRAVSAGQSHGVSCQRLFSK